MKYPTKLVSIYYFFCQLYLASNGFEKFQKEYSRNVTNFVKRNVSSKVNHDYYKMFDGWPSSDEFKWNGNEWVWKDHENRIKVTKVPNIIANIEAPSRVQVNIWISILSFLLCRVKLWGE